MKHSFSFLLSNNSLKIYCNLIPQSDLKHYFEVLQASANDSIILLHSKSCQLYKTAIDNLNITEELPKFTEDNDKIKLIACGSKLNMAYTEKGMLYAIPEKLNFANPDIIKIHTGQEHCLLLDKMGNVYSYGRGSRGQLGHGQLDDESHPRLMEALAGIKITDIAAGGWHSAAISHDGDVYTWGWNGNGQLGLSTSTEEEKAVSVMATPHVIDVESCSENRVIMIACGNKHTIVLMDNNILYGSGWNKYKQLKNEEQENYYSFVYLHDFSNECVTDLKCGPWNSAVICS